MIIVSALSQRKRVERERELDKNFNAVEVFFFDNRCYIIRSKYASATPSFKT